MIDLDEDPPTPRSYRYPPADKPNLRDLFAAAALAGILAKYGDGADASTRARAAYELADAMLEARGQ